MQLAIQEILGCFGVPREFVVTIPKDYSHINQLKAFDERLGRNEPDDDVYCLDQNFCEENFNKTSDKLKAGKTYVVSFFPVLDLVSAQYCLELLRHKQSLLVSAQGLTLFSELNKDMFLFGKEVTAFDVDSSLWTDEQMYSWLPVVQRQKDGSVCFSLTHNKAFFTPTHEVLCVNNA